MHFIDILVVHGHGLDEIPFWSIESDVNMHIANSWTAIHWIVIIHKSDLSGFWETNGSPNLTQTIRPSDSKQKQKKKEKKKKEKPTEPEILPFRLTTG